MSTNVYENVKKKIPDIGTGARTTEQCTRQHKIPNYTHKIRMRMQPYSAAFTLMYSSCTSSASASAATLMSSSKA